MANKLNRRSQQRLKRMVDSLENISKFSNKIKIDDLEELVRRDAVGVDTYAASNTGSSVVLSSRGSSSELTPVERAVEASAFGRKTNDPVRREIKNIEQKILQSEENLRRIIESINFLKEGVEKKRNRATTEPCEICMVLPAVKTAMCATCHAEWVGEGAPDRFRWKAFKRELKSSDGIPLVTEQPAPRHLPRNT